MLDFGDQLFDAREAATPDCSLSDDPKPALHLIEPGGVGRRVVDVEPWTLRQPGADFGVLVRAVVVDDQVHVELGRDLLVDPPQETQKLLVPVPGFALGDHRTSGYVQGGKQRCGAVAVVVVGAPLDVAQAHRQQRLGAVQGLDLRFLVNAEHNCLIGRVEVEPDDVADFLDKKRIVGELERFLAVGLQGEGLQPAVRRTFGDACSSRQGASCPLRAAVCGLALQGPIDHLGHFVILIGARPPWPELVVQTLQAEVPVTLAPLAYGHARQAHPLGNGCVGFTGSASQHDLRPLHDRMGQRP